MKKFVVLFVLLLACFSLSGCTSDPNIKKIQKETKLNTSKSEKIFKTLQDVGIDEISSFKCNQVYCTAENSNLLSSYFSVYIDNGKVSKISDYQGHTFFENGSVKSNIFDYNMTVSSLIYLVETSEAKTKTILKSPASAVFPDWKQWGVKIEKDIVEIEGFVDSQNSFGAMLRTPLSFTYKSGLRGFVFVRAKVGNIVIE